MPPKQLTRYQRQYARLREQNKCPTCRQPLGEGDIKGGHSYCRGCREDKRIFGAAAVCRENGLCTACKAMLEPDSKHVKCADCRRKDVAYQGARVADRVAKGICRQCGKAKAAKGRQCCPACVRELRKMGRDQRAGWRENKQCTGCGGEVEFERDGFLTCDKCAGYRRNKVQRWRDAGKCTSCGKERDREGYKTCLACSEYFRAWHAKRKAQREENKKKAFYLCGRCGKANDRSTHKFCTACDKDIKELREDRVMCAECLADTEDGAKFCEHHAEMNRERNRRAKAKARSGTGVRDLDDEVLSEVTILDVDE